MVAEGTVYREHPAAWLQEHLSTIGGSNAAASLGKGRFKKAWQLWDQMHAVIVDRKVPEPAKVSVDMRRGAIFEPVARLLLAEHYGVPIEAHPQDRFIYKPDLPWAHTLPDGWLCKRPVELKVPRPGTVTKCNLHGLLEDWWIQAQHTLALTDQDLCYMGLLDPITATVHAFEVDRDDAFIAQVMAGEERFWASVYNGPRPEEDFDDPEPATDQRVTLSGDEINRVARAYNSLKVISKETEEALEDAKTKLRELSGGAQAWEVPGVIRVYDRVCGGSAGKRCVDEAMLEALYPDAFKDERLWKVSGGRKASARFMAYNIENAI